MKKIVILGAGTGGTISAHQLRKKLNKKEWEITIIDKNQMYYYQPGFLFLPFRFRGYEELSDVSKPIKRLLPEGGRFCQ